MDQDYFSGREGELGEFKSFIKGERAYRVLFIHGPGGIGKTWLLRKMIEVAKSEKLPNLLVANEFVDMYSTANHSVDGLRESLVNLLEVAWGKPAFNGFRRRQHDLEIGLQENFGEESLKSLRQNLQKAFLEDCRSFSKDQKVVMFFDTFERVQRDQVGSWVLVELLRSLPHFLFVVASRETWGGNTLVHSHQLEGFSSNEAQELFEKKGWSDSDRELLDIIREKAFGEPLKIELAVELSDDLLQNVDKLRVLSHDEFDEALIAPFRKTGEGFFSARDLDVALLHTIRFLACFNRRFNADMLKLFIQYGLADLRGVSPDEVIEKLSKEFFFVKTRPDGYIQLHDEMERLVNQYLWPEIDRTWDKRRELTRVVCEWYDEQIKLAKGLETTADDLQAEQLVYLFDLDLDKADELLRTYGYGSFGLNNLLVVEIKPEKVESLPTKYRYPFAADFGDRARRVYLWGRGQEYWKIAVEAARQADNTDQIIDALLGLHNCTHPLLDLEESLRILNQALEFCEGNKGKRAIVLYELGFTNSKMQNMVQALEFYSQALDAAVFVKDRELTATILNDMGYAYVFIGQYKKAGYLVKTALELRQGIVRDLEALLSDVRESN